MRMRAHLKSSCHERGVRRARTEFVTQSFITSVAAAASRQCAVDPQPEALSRLYCCIARETQSKWPMRSIVVSGWGRMLRCHAASMNTWWRRVLASTRLPPELQREVAEWLHVDVGPWPCALSGFSKSGNLTIPDWRWEVASRRRQRRTLFHAPDSATTQAKRRRISADDAQSTALCSRESTCARLRYFSTYAVNHPLLCTC